VVCLIEYGFGAPILERFAQTCDVVLVRRGQRSLRSRVKESLKLRLHRFFPAIRSRIKDEIGLVAWRQGVRVKWTRSVNAPEFRVWLRAQRADVLVVAGFGQIVKPETIAAAPVAVNFHPSLLPAYRGPTPSHWIIGRGETISGVTCHRLTEGIDSGEIFFQTSFPVTAEMTEAQHEEKAASLGAGLVPALVEAVRNGKLVGKPQDESKASYFGFPDAKLTGA
jgi:methionyl-tRNA formyltransferase